MKNNNIRKTGTFCISLDFELNWGIFEKRKIQNQVEFFNNTLKVIPEILRLFSKYKIHATWASVGFLFFKDLSELIQNLPEQIPSYNNEKVSSYQYIYNNYQEKYAPYHFARGLIQQIQQTDGQEIATHTLSHYYCLESGQTPADFKADLSKHIEIANNMNIDIKSLVFPRNQHNSDYDKIVKEVGITAIRTNPNIWFWNTEIKDTILKRIPRGIDAYLPLATTCFDMNNNENNLPVSIPASRFFRPAGKFVFLNKLKLRRIKKEMSHAAKNNKYYHIWWHPHNFGYNPSVSLLELEEILKHYQKLYNKYNFTSKNMNEITESLV